MQRPFVFLASLTLGAGLAAGGGRDVSATPGQAAHTHQHAVAAGSGTALAGCSDAHHDSQQQHCRFSAHCTTGSAVALAVPDVIAAESDRVAGGAPAQAAGPSRTFPPPTPPPIRLS